MVNTNSETLIYDIFEDQNRIIGEHQKLCISKYGENVTNVIHNYSTIRSHCPPSWDGIACWPGTPAGTIAKQECSSFFHIKGFNLENLVTKHCLKNGYWYMKDGNYWTNFSQCYEQNDTKVFFVDPKITNGSQLIQEYLPLLKIVKETGYSISLVTLIIALLIMISIRKLHCSRNILHMHLFASFILRASIFLLKDVAFLDGLGLSLDIVKEDNATFFNINLDTNNWQCKFFMSLWQYFSLANYSWILMEGLYLYNLIFRALFTDSGGSIFGYVIMGWGLPLLVVTLWILVRVYTDDTLCWTTDSSALVYYFIIIPTAISVVVNLIFFLRISMVLLNKLKSPLNEDNRAMYMKWAKSTLVLVPLFGVNYIIFLGLKFIKNDVVELIWIVCDSIFGSFQGLFVAVLYCFLNSEVKTELKLYFYRIIPFVAANRFLIMCCPCREKLLRSTKARISVSTTLSCSSLYANGLGHIRNNIRIKDSHNCELSKRTSQDNSYKVGINFYHNRKPNVSNKAVNNDHCMEMCNLYQADVKPSQEEYSFMLPQQY